MTLVPAVEGKKGSEEQGLPAWHLPPMCVRVQTSVRHLPADNRKPLCSEGTSCSRQLAGFDVALGWPWGPLLPKSRTTFQCKRRGCVFNGSLRNNNTDIFSECRPKNSDKLGTLRKKYVEKNTCTLFTSLGGNLSLPCNPL